MPSAAPSVDLPWSALTPEAVAELFGSVTERWWISGGVALDLWQGSPIRERDNIDVSTLGPGAAALVAALPPHMSAWIDDTDEGIVAYGSAAQAADIRIRVYDERANAFVMRINVEDGAPAAWVYLRDPRLQLPWERAVRDIDGIPIGAPEVQLVWKALRPRPVDDIDKDATLPRLSPEAVAFYETALLRIHPHSTWAIHVRSPFAPAKASWNRKNA